MTILPEVQTMRELILKDKSAKELDAMLAKLRKMNPVFKTSEKLAYKIAADKLGIKIEVQTDTNLFEDSEVQDEDEYTKLGKLEKSRLKIANVNAYIIDIGEERTTKKGNQIIYITVVDETGSAQIQFFSDAIEEFLADGFKVGEAVSFGGLLIKDSEGKGLWVRGGKYTTWKHYDPETDGKICDVSKLKGRKIANLRDTKYELFSGMVASAVEEKSSYPGCPNCYSSMKSGKGSRVFCKKCHDTVTVVGLPRKSFVVADATGDVIVDVPPWQVENFPDIGEGDSVLVRGGPFKKDRNALSMQAILVTKTFSFVDIDDIEEHDDEESDAEADEQHLIDSSDEPPIEEEEVSEKYSPLSPEVEKVIATIIAKSDLHYDEIRNLIDKKKEELEFLINDTAASFIVAKDAGIDTRDLKEKEDKPEKKPVKKKVEKKAGKKKKTQLSAGKITRDALFEVYTWGMENKDAPLKIKEMLGNSNEVEEDLLAVVNKLFDLGFMFQPQKNTIQIMVEEWHDYLEAFGFKKETNQKERNWFNRGELEEQVGEIIEKQKKSTHEPKKIEKKSKKELSIKDLNFGDEKEFKKPSKTIIKAAEEHFNSIIGMWGSMVPEELRTVLATRESGIKYRMKPIIKYLLDQKIAMLVKKGGRVALRKV